MVQLQPSDQKHPTLFAEWSDDLTVLQVDLFFLAFDCVSPVHQTGYVISEHPCLQYVKLFSVAILSKAECICIVPSCQM